TKSPRQTPATPRASGLRIWSLSRLTPGVRRCERDWHAICNSFVSSTTMGLIHCGRKSGGRDARNWNAVASAVFVGLLQLEDQDCFRLALLFWVVPIFAAFFGFGLVAGLASDAAKIFFFIFIVLAVIAFIGGALRSPPV